MDQRPVPTLSHLSNIPFLEGDIVSKDFFKTEVSLARCRMIMQRVQLPSTHMVVGSRIHIGSSLGAIADRMSFFGTRLALYPAEASCHEYPATGR